MTASPSGPSPDLSPDRESGWRRWRRPALLAAGVVLAAVMLVSPPPPGLSAAGWATAALGALIAFWWMTEAAPLATTALLPLLLFPLFGVETLTRTAAAYANPLIFLFLGGFLMARAMERHGLNRRLATALVRRAGNRPGRIVAGLMAATAFLSMWISNTATIMVMLPIALSMLPRNAAEGGGAEGGGAEGGGVDRNAERFATALLLGIAYAGTIGGMSTLIGTPPNAIFAGFMQETYGLQIGFAQWMIIGLPVTLILLPLTWLLLVKGLFRFGPVAGLPLPGADGAPAEAPPPLTAAQKRVALVVAAAGLCWLLRPLAAALWKDLPVTDTTIAVAAAVLLFLIPEGGRRDETARPMARPQAPQHAPAGRGFTPLLTWQDAAHIRWDVLILFGGGLALADAISRTGVAAWIGGGLAGLGDLPVFLLILVVTSVIVYLGELASNTAMAAVFLPVGAATAVAMGQPALFLTLPIALAASLGFMLPVATPPNAIVFGSGRVAARHMLLAGAILNIIGILVTAAISTSLGFWAFGVS